MNAFKRFLTTMREAVRGHDFLGVGAGSDGTAGYASGGDGGCGYGFGICPGRGGVPGAVRSLMGRHAEMCSVLGELARLRKPTQKVNLREIPASYRAIFSNPLAKYCFGGVLMEGIFLFGIFPYVAQLLHQI